MKKVVTYFFTIIMAICLIVLINFIAIYNTVLNCNFILHTLNKIDYYGLIDTSIKNEFESYIKQSGLDKEILENVYTKQQVKEDINTTIKMTYGYAVSPVNTKTIRDNLNNNISSYIEQNGISLSKSEKRNMENFVEKLVNVYESQISHPVYLDTIKLVLSKVSFIMERYKAIIFASPIVLAFGIIILNIKNKYEAFKLIALGALISSVFIILGIILLKLKINIDSIIILNMNFSLAVSNILKSIIYKLIIAQVLICFISVITILLCNRKMLK